jgi:MFS family permease
LESVTSPSIQKVLFVIFALVFFEFLIMGASLGILPQYVHTELKYSDLIVGLTIGVQYIATLFVRPVAGRMSDLKGGRGTVTTGLLISSGSGFFYLFSVLTKNEPAMALSSLMVGRILLGIGESYAIIGVFKWGFSLVGSKDIAKVMVWNGMGMYAGIACGAPIAIWLKMRFSIEMVFVSIVLLPLISLLIMSVLPSGSADGQRDSFPFLKAFHLVWKSGIALALGSIGFSSIAGFITLYFEQRSWAGASFALSAFGAGYVVVRIFFSGFPDRLGGRKIAVISFVIQILGQLVLWSAGSSLTGILGAGITGIGMSLVFPSLGKLAINNVKSEHQGTAIAAYNMFFDLGMGLTPSIAGIIAKMTDYSNIYLFGALTTALSALIIYVDRETVKH